MHDQSLEQRLRAALQTEGDGLAFTITSAELERRQALRRRGGLSPLASLGLAAAVGVGLLGLVGVAGGWFEQRTAITPPVSPPPAGPGLSAPPSGRTAGDTLPTLDELIGTRDPATVVRAQSVGPEQGPDAGTPPDPRSVHFGPVTATGTYAVELACIGSVDLQLQVINGNPDVPGRSEPFACDGLPSSRHVDLVVGDSLGIKTSGSPSWRIVVLAQPGPASEATTIDTTFGPPTGDVSLSIGTSETEPTFVGTPAPLDSIVPIELEPVGPRLSYRILTSCAGPGPIRYLFGSRAQDGPLAIEATSTTAVACDGAVHADDLGLAERNGAQIFVVADPRVVWRVMVAAEIPPVSIARNDATWTMREAIGPTVELADNYSLSLSSGLEGKERDIRVVISCLGGTGVEVTVHDLDPTKPAVGSFHVDCSGPDPTTVAKTFTLHHPEYIVEVQPTGEMWLAATVQGRVPASPAP